MQTQKANFVQWSVLVLAIAVVIGVFFTLPYCTILLSGAFETLAGDA